MKFFYQTMLVLSSVFLFSCHQISDRKLRCYENPLKTTDSTELYIADPFIYKAGGLYYLTGTTALPEGEGFAYYISSDLIRWKYQGLLYRKPKDHIGCYGFWAPEVKYYEGRFYMTYSCYMKDLDRMLTCLAVSEKPGGPTWAILPLMQTFLLMMTGRLMYISAKMECRIRWLLVNFMG